MTLLEERARALGIETSYADVWGKEHRIAKNTLEALTGALGSPQEQALQVMALAADRAIRLSIPDANSWKLADENGNVLHCGNAPGNEITLPPLSTGYYDLQAGKQHVRLIVSPPRCWMPAPLNPELPQRRRVWGIAVQLYGLRSKSNWGIGDFSDLAMLADDMAKLGATTVGVNPLHALFPSDPEHYSPYAPSSRLFLNPLYIGLDAERFPALNVRIKTAQASDLVDYREVWRAKSEAFGILFKDFHGDEDFDRFCSEQSEPLRRQALFNALMEHFAKQNSKPVYWQDWSAEYQKPESRQVRDFAQSHAERLRYYGWLQWQADRQLKQAGNGLEFGIYRDLAVGASKGGAEVWQDSGQFICSASIGAPPDRYNPLGQDWGLPPFNPQALRQHKLQPFIQLLRANMRHGGMLRIDHAFGLDRLFLIPEGMGAKDGAYVHYPFKEMLAALKVESHRNQCLVIGEGLGTPPPDYEEKAGAAGLLSSHVFYFEKDEHGYFPPSHYPARALATLSTHDLPTMEGWLRNADIDERAKLNLYPSREREEHDRAERKDDRDKLEKALEKARLANGETADGVMRYLARSPAAIVLMQMEDALGVVPQANLPTTTDERPNWRMKLPQDIKSIMQSEHFRQLARRMNEERDKPLMRIPRATYRLQLHKDFSFYDAARIIPYLARLGISHVYVSPYMKACPGSTHGYDVIDYNTFNPELGGEEGYQVFRAALAEHGMGQLLDFVSNHMGISCGNPWWEDVKAHGRDSPYAGYFDIDWEASDDGLKYRRFFNIDGMAGVRVEQSEVFDAIHTLVLSLIKKGGVQGLRIDHIDGLADPAGYCRKLREKAGGGIYLLVEKILAPEEQLPAGWSIQGTTGYDALNQIGGIFVDQQNEGKMDTLYRSFTGHDDYTKTLCCSRKNALKTMFGQELSRITRKLEQTTNTYLEGTLKQALADIIACFPVYRTYITERENSAQDRTFIAKAVENASNRGAISDKSIYSLIGNLLILEAENPGEAQLNFVRMFQQFTGAVAAKGMEDTAFYRYNRLLSLNEVGGDPARFGIAPEEFHRLQRARAEHWPHSMLATATHDTKRGEDARMRLHALSEMPQAWETWLSRWSEINRADISRNDECFLYQTLLASWPLQADSASEEYEKRMTGYLTKALREAKVETSWSDQNQEYEQTALDFALRIMHSPEFLADFLPAVQALSHYGVINSMAQTVLKLTLPGVPDIYQGCEYWDFSLVDPDNRRPVDYAARERLPADIPLPDLLDGWQDGRVKQCLIQSLLAHREARQALYDESDYQPLEIRGKHAEHVLGFTRCHQDSKLVVLVPRLTASLVKPGEWPLGDPVWADTHIMLPPGEFSNLLTGDTLQGGHVAVAQLLKHFPAAALEGKVL